MCDESAKNVKVKETKGSRRGKGKNNKIDETALQEEVIDLLRSEGFIVIPPLHKQCARDESQNKTPHGDTKKKAAKKVVTDASSVCGTEKTKAKKVKEMVERTKENRPSTSKDMNKMKQKALGPKVENTQDSKALKKKKERARMEKKQEKKQERSLRFDNNEGEAEDAKTLPESPKIKKNQKEDDVFPNYIRKQVMLQLLAEQDPGKPMYVRGSVRINAQNFNEAYLSIDGQADDILISGVKNRNRAMDRDIVAVMINPEENWIRRESGKLQRTGTVMCILEKIHPRRIVGTLVTHKNRLRLFSRDQRVPTLTINPKSIPEEVLASPREYAKALFLARLDAWITPYNCKGSIESIIGTVGDLEGETAAILFANGLDVEPYGDELLKDLPESDYVPSPDEIKDREDWRQVCVFTIDPATAVDLDDAVSCKKLPNGNYEVGVHISDVTHYLMASSPLDEEVAKRATTVYLVNRVYHMLPKALCNVCSLTPGRDKLAFSVVWEMTPEALVIKHRFVKSVVKSCYQMSYATAQAMIDEPSKEWKELSGLVTTEHTPDHICRVVNELYALSSQMRERRFAQGALAINRTKLQIILDKDTRVPISYCIEERQESNRLIEEFMLLANMTVAQHLYEAIPDTAFLRNHGEPLERVLSKTVEDLEHLGIHLKIDSAASLQASLELYEKTGLEEQAEKFATSCLMMVINCLCSKSMTRATYICSGQVDDKESLRHFALNVPLYTHFTSPIRRYADCVVHRLLNSSITKTPMPDDWSADFCAKIAANCNDKKYSAKIAQEKSNELYFMDLLARKGPTETMAVVMKVEQRSMYVILCYVGITLKIVYSDFEKKVVYEYNKEHSVSTLVVKWRDTELVQTINVFSIINLKIEKHPKKYSIRATLLPTRLDDAVDCT